MRHHRQGDLRALGKAERKKALAAERDLIQELVPKATGREAVAANRLARREEAKARDASPDRAFLPGGGDMMGGDDSIHAARAREARREESFRNRYVQLIKLSKHTWVWTKECADDDLKLFLAL